MKQICYGCFLIVCILLSCKPRDDAESFYNIKTVIPFSHSFYTDVPQVKDADGNMYPFTKIEYDTIDKNTCFSYDSIPGKAVTLTFFSLLTNDQVNAIKPKQDTCILFDTTAYSPLIKGDANDVLSMQTDELDTLFIGCYSSGCGSPFMTKMKIFRVDTTYTVICSDLNVIKETSYTVPQSLFKEAFAAYRKDCRKLFPETAANGSRIICISTVMTRMYVRNGNTLYEFPRFSQWGGYETFFNTISRKVDIPVTEQEPEDHTWDTILVKQKNK
ncbi:hypothetical protein [Cytophaga hutchinsonii]|uniref:Lipoprotein n=1 Tax=Cytophaga hutchinsonii (strain ATCC 33406 / DSM 1761 / CIP 103989 / NBRC 15051 / NCIMB 9469 / D465) TaxID=269798 RepID=A0A6N4SQA3_CYTH3|nr:hypothetical protein [Cytophaga hutchinsonii]ABG58476.1 hypothetical protein CHU_1201 [Cytophaga hutchinsonii ATCC 33406]SFX75202.1 hypothetical protein SAMN04487930_10942 [Cytophaga hutchinsonii ATCC 33406]